MKWMNWMKIVSDVNEWSTCMNEQMNEWSEMKSTEWMSEWMMKSTNNWMNEWMSDLKNETNEWMNESMKGVNEGLNEVNEWTNAWTNHFWAVRELGVHVQSAIIQRTEKSCKRRLYGQNPAVQTAKADWTSTSPGVPGCSWANTSSRSKQHRDLTSDRSHRVVWTNRIASPCGWSARRCLFRTGVPQCLHQYACAHMSMC